MILIAIISIHHPAYFTWENAKVVGLSSSYTLIAALGTAFLMIGGNIDLSIGSNLALAAVVAALLANHVGSVPAILLAILLAGAVRVANGLLVWRVKLSPLIITLGSLTAIEGVVQVLTGGGADFSRCRRTSVRSVSLTCSAFQARYSSPSFSSRLRTSS